jgi:hypothetical protein
MWLLLEMAVGAVMVAVEVVLQVMVERVAMVVKHGAEHCTPLVVMSYWKIQHW